MRALLNLNRTKRRIFWCGALFAFVVIYML